MKASMEDEEVVDTFKDVFQQVSCQCVFHR